MIGQNKFFLPRWGLTLLVMATLTLLTMFFGLAWPASLQAGPTLPPRIDEFPPRTATPRPNRDDDDKDKNMVIGAYIVLQVQGGTAPWSWVEWQDGLGHWHRVDGWQGSLDDRGIRIWWVSPKDFGSGPFRWVVAQSPETIIETSDPFFLPQMNQSLVVVVPLTKVK